MKQSSSQLRQVKLFRSNQFNRFLFYIMMQQCVLIWSIHIVIVVVIYYVCALPGTSFIISSIWLIIVGNSKIRDFFLFQMNIFLHNLTHFIFSMHSHSYFITHKYGLLFWFYHIHPKKDWSLNKKKNKEGTSTKINFVSKGGWPQ